MSIGSIGGVGSLLSGAGNKTGPGAADGISVLAGPEHGNAEPTLEPRTVLHPHPNIELHGAPTPEIEPRIHLHPEPVIEPRPVLHYDVEITQDRTKVSVRTRHQTKLPSEDQINKRPARDADL